MGHCYNCGLQFTLKDKEVRCDNPKCQKIVTYCCWKCREYFEIKKDNGQKLEECPVCSFFYCPNCKVCGETCSKSEWFANITIIMNDNQLNLNEKIEKIVHYIGEIKQRFKQKECPKRVPISYAKKRIKECLTRLSGFKNKDAEDTFLFNKRMNLILDNKVGTIFTITQGRDKGTYGQEFRDVVNLLICRGKIKINKIKNTEGKFYNEYERIDNNACSKFKEDQLFVRYCSKCDNTYFDMNKIYCENENCIIKKGKDKGKKRMLIIKTSNIDTCQLERGLFNNVKIDVSEINEDDYNGQE